MNKYSSLFLLLLAFTWQSPSQAADFFLAPAPEFSLNNSQQQRLQSFFTNAEMHLPPEIKKSIGRKIIVRFTRLDSYKDIRIVCDQEKPATPQATPVYGNTPKPAFFSKEKFSTVELHSGFLLPLLNGTASSQAIPCRHKSIYQLAMATLIHELVHIYDLQSPRTKEEDYALSHCSSDTPDEYCKFLDRKQGLVSEDERFLLISGWRFNNGMISFANELAPRSADRYEFQNPQEAFAVNMEYFLLDPDFSCRRPSMYRYFREKFGTPFSQPKCANQLPLSDFPSEFTDLGHVWAIHLLIAEPGVDVDSKWGHAMFRLIVCSPRRTQMGPECEQDIEYHRVISSRGFVNDFMPSGWKLINGDYSSQFFQLSFPQIIQSYNREEFRNIASYPLRLSEKEKADFLAAVLEQFWVYKGKYFFFTNNCASEALNLLKQALPNKDLQWTSTQFLTPNGLYKLLSRLHYIDQPPDIGSAKQKGLYFESRSRMLRAAAEKILLQKGRKEVDPFSWALNSSLVERKAGYLDTLPREIKAEYLTVEDLLISYKQQLLLKELGKNLKDENSSDFEETLKGLQPVLQAKGYGVPSEQEYAEFLSIFERQRIQIAPEVVKIQEWARDKSATSFAEIEAMKKFRNELIQSIVKK